MNLVELIESEPLSATQQQSAGDVSVSGEDNAFALVNTAGNAAIDQSRYVIYNYYYRQETVSVALAPEATSEDELHYPYRGLFHFGPDDAAYFFGREVFVTELVAAVENRAFVPVLGASGSGKSSVVLAGLVPRLQQTGQWLFTHFRPGEDPFHALALALVPLYAPEQDATDQIAQARKLATYLQSGEVQLGDAIARIQQNYPNQRVLLIADQFEELYTLCPQEETRRQFLDCLLTCLPATLAKVSMTNVSPLVLVATMRADFLGSALSYRPFADVLQGGDVKLGAMNSVELSEVIERPVAKLGVTFEAGLAHRILKAVEHEPGNLPLLEFALTELWKRRSHMQLTHAAYEAIGEVEGALARYADEQYGRLSEAEQAQVRRIFVQLVRPGEGTEDTRRLATKAELGEERWELVKRLADNRLVVTSQDEAKRETVEVVHEALISNWGELQKWMTTDREFRTWQERLRGAMQLWETTNQDEGALLRGAALVEAQEKFKNRQEELASSEAEFIQQSIELRNRYFKAEAARRRRNIKVAWSITITSLIAGIASSTLGVMLLSQQKQEKLKLADTLAQTSMLQLNSGKELEALISGIEAGQILERQNENSLSVVEALTSAVAEVIEQNRLIGHLAPIRGVEFSPDGKTIATASDDKTVKLWTVEGQLLTTLDQHDDGVSSVSFSPIDENIIVTGSWDNKVRFWDKNGQLLHTLQEHTAPVFSISFSSDGKTIATAGRDKTVYIWSIEEILKGSLDKIKPKTSIKTDYEVREVSFSPDNNTIATANTDGVTKVWNLEGQLLLPLDGHRGGVNSVAFSPNGKIIATAGVDKTAKLWNLDGHLLYTLNGHESSVERIIFSPDGKTIATASRDSTAKIWDTEGHLLHTFLGHTADVMSIAFSPNSDILATTSVDETAKLWDLEKQKSHTLLGHTEAVTSAIFISMALT